MAGDPRSVIERYFASLVAHDWLGLSECLSPDVVRVGPFGDQYSPRGPYVEFLSSLMPTLEAYSLRVDRLRVDGSVVVAQLSETMEIDGSPVETRESLVFDVDDTGLIQRIDIYIQRSH